MYKVVTLVEVQTPNPDFDRTQPITDDNFPTEPLPVGTEIESIEAWRLCFPQYGDDFPRAEPADDVTRAKVEAEQKRINARKAERERLERERVEEANKVRAARRKKRLADRQAAAAKRAAKK